MQVSICMLIQMMGRNILYLEMSIELGLAIIKFCFSTFMGHWVLVSDVLAVNGYLIQYKKN